MEQSNSYHDIVYKDLNLPLLKIYAKNWRKRFPCIESISLYMAGPENGGTDIEYIIAANAPEFPQRKLPEDENKWTAEDERDWDLIKYHNWTQRFDVRDDEIGKVYKGDPPPDYNFQWMWYSLAINEDIENHNLDPEADFVLIDTGIVLYEKKQNARIDNLLSVVGNSNLTFKKPFPELNLPHLKMITQRWVKHYQEWGVNFQKITLYRYASSYSGAAIKTTYAIVFDISHYEPRTLPGASATTQDCINHIIEDSKLPHDPYSEFIYRDLGYNSTIVNGLPDKLSFGDFHVVYNPPRIKGDEFEKEWKVIPLFAGAILSKQVRQDEPFELLYPRTATHNIPSKQHDVEISQKERLPQKSIAASENRLKNGVVDCKTDEIVKNITIRYENDSQISIQQKGKAKTNINLTGLGFKEGGKGGERKTWDNFITALQNPPNFYWHAPENKDKQQVYQVNKRLLELLSIKFNVNFSDKFKLIERVPGAGKGVYGFGCKIEYKDITEDIGPKDKKVFRDLFFSTVEQWEKEFANSTKQRLSERIQQLASEGFEKYFLTESEVNDMFSKPDLEKETIKDFQLNNPATITPK